jgi:molybdenum cofactor guanylyltransferase
MTGEPAARPALVLVLDGGAARRMGGADKTLLPLGHGDTLLSLLLRRVQPQARAAAISANGPAERFSATGLPVLPDTVGPSWGPLAGVLAGLDHLAATDADGWLLTVPGDTPLVPLDLARRLGKTARTGRHRCVRAVSGGRRHPLVALWSVAVRDPLRQALCERGLRRVEAFQDQQGAGDAIWPDQPYDPFFNVNTPADLDEVRRIRAIGLS